MFTNADSGVRGLGETPRKAPEHPSHAVSRCVDRIAGLVSLAIPGAKVEILGDGPGGRVDLLASLMGQPLGQSFVLKHECQRAWDDDPGRCRPIDQLALTWISVLKVRVRDVKCWRRVSSKLRNRVGEARA